MEITNGSLQADLLVIGGGINGTSVALDAAGRGLSVILCEQNDLASATSSASSKMIHGGLRYLEQYRFKLVREALTEREILMKKAPHLIHPISFILPHHRRLRPAWMIRVGLFFYDHLSQHNTLPKSHRIHLHQHLAGKALKSEYQTGFCYSDCQTNDARLVISNALAAKEKNARILTQCQCIDAKRLDDHWQVSLQKKPNEIIHAQVKAIVNAAGPWVKEVLTQILHLSTSANVKWVQGSHIVFPKLYEGNHAYILQNTDKRIIFVFPFEENYTAIGTTDTEIKDDPRTSQVLPMEIDYLCQCVNNYFKLPVDPKNMIWSFCGVRGLYDDAAHNPAFITREHHLVLEDHEGRCPVVSIFGGKITTNRMVAQQVMQKLQPYFPNLGSEWTAQALLPGGDLDGLPWNDYCQKTKKQYSQLPNALINRLLRTYGSLIHILLNDCNHLHDLGEHFGHDLYQKEVDYLITHEWALTTDDILWRRTKLGLQFGPSEVTKLAHYLAEYFNTR